MLVVEAQATVNRLGAGGLRDTWFGQIRALGSTEDRQDGALLIAPGQLFRRRALAVPGGASRASREEQAHGAGIALVRRDVQRRVPLRGRSVHVGSCVEQ